MLSDTSTSLGFGQLNPLKRTQDAEILVLFHGNSSDIALTVQNDLAQQGRSADVISVPFLKPLDGVNLLREMVGRKVVVVIEEHCQTGGLASAVAEVLVTCSARPLFKAYNLGDSYSHFVGNQQYIREQFGFTAQAILQDLAEFLHKTTY